MLKIRDLGINAIPGRRYELGACENSRDSDDRDKDYGCKDCSAKTDEGCDEESRADICNDCTATGRPKYHAAGFTGDAVAQLRQQLDDRMGERQSWLSA